MGGNVRADSDQVDDFDRLSPHIAAALVYAKGSHTVQDVKDAIDRGDAQFWPGVESVIVTEVVDTPQQRELHYWLAGGNGLEIQNMYHAVSEWGRRIGCKVEKMVGRAGWERTWLTKEAGWKPLAVLYVKEVGV
jgi:hypothetical protein